MNKRLVVVAPTFNEEESVNNFVAEVLSQQKRLPNIDLVVLISDSHSSDRTAQIARKLATHNSHVKFLDTHIPGPGKLGSGLSAGLDYAITHLKADYIITMEADLSNDPSQIPDFVKNLDRADLVIGSRYSGGGRIINWSWWRRALSRGANLILMAICLTYKTHEFTNLYRAFTKETWLKLRPSVSSYDNWLFVPAFAFESLAQKIKITEQPIYYFDRFGGRSKMKTLSYTLDLLHYAAAFRLTKSASFLKFLVVGTLGFIINTAVLELGVKAGLAPYVSGPLGAECAIISNFILNNVWTFSDRQLTSWTQIPYKYIQFNALALGSVVIQFAFLKVGEILLGQGQYAPVVNLPLISILNWYRLFYVLGVGVGLIWNYIMYSRVVWKKKSR